MQISWTSWGLCVIMVAVSVSAEPPAAQDCSGGKVDVTFVLDYSRSVGENNFKNFMLPTVVAIINGLGPISQDSVRVATVGFSTYAYKEFDFNQYTDKARLLSAIQRLIYKDGNTATGDALFIVRNELAKQVRPGVTHLVVVITDGVYNEGRRLDPEAVELRKTGAEVFAVGVGAYMDKNELLKIAGSEDHVLLLKDFNDLLLRAKDITKMTCKTVSLVNKEVKKEESSPNCTSGGKTEFTFILDASGSVGANNFETNVKSAVKAIVGSLSVGPTGDRVALVKYSTAASMVFNLDTFSSSAQIYNAVQNIQFDGGITATGEAIALVQQQVVPKVRIGASHVVVVITDGNTNTGRPVNLAAAALKATGAQIFTVGVGISISRSELLEIASKPENVISVNDYAELKKRALGIAQLACKSVELEDKKLPLFCRNRQEVFLTMVVDNSAAQGQEHFRGRLLQYLAAIVTTLTPLQTSVNFALVTFSSSARLEFDFRTYGQNFTHITNHIASLQLANATAGQGRVLGQALNLVRTELSGQVRRGGHHVVALFTAGEPTDCSHDSATQLVESGAKVIVVASHHQMEKRTQVDLSSMSADVEGKMKAILNYGEKTDNSVRVHGFLSVMCSIVPRK